MIRYFREKISTVTNWPYWGIIGRDYYLDSRNSRICGVEKQTNKKMSFLLVLSRKESSFKMYVSMYASFCISVTPQ